MKKQTHTSQENIPADPLLLQEMVTKLWEQNSLLSQKTHHLEKSNADLEQHVTSLTKKNTNLALQIEKLQRQLVQLKKKQFGKSSEKLVPQIQDLELQIEEHEAELPEEDLRPDASGENGDDAAGAVSDSSSTTTHTTKKTAKRKPLPEGLPRDDVMLQPDPLCPECGSDSFRKIADDVSETLEFVPASFRVIRYIRPRCACTACDRIVQAYVPSKTIAKGKAGPGLLAHICISKYCDSLPFYRQSEIYAREGIDLARSTMASWAGQCARLLDPLVEAMKKDIFTASHLHGDDTSVPVLAPGLGRTKTGRLWVYVRDGRPHGSEEPPAACYFYSPDRKKERPAEHLAGYTGTFHADAYAGYNPLYRDGGIQEVACWAHARRKFYEATVSNPKASIASRTLEKIAALYAVEDDIRGKSPDERSKMRQIHAMPLLRDLIAFWKQSLPKLPKLGETAKAIRYAFNQEAALSHYITDGKAEMDNNAAERAMRKIALGRKNWLFVGSDNGGDTAANFYTLIESAKLNNVDPHAYLRNVLTVIQDHNSQKLHELFPWNIKLS